MTFLRNAWYVAAAPSEIGQEPFARTFLNEDVLLYRTQAGASVAMSRHCPHRFAALDQGKRVGDAIQCPYHGPRFDPTGRCVFAPSADAVPPHATLKVYPIVERYAYPWIWLGDPALADSSDIPDYAYLEDTDFDWFDGYLHVGGNYLLLVDNLLDLSHTEFLHPLLSVEGWMDRNAQTIKQEGNSIHVNNVACNDTMMPLLQQLRPDMHPVGTQYQNERWDAPSSVKLYAEFHSGSDQLRFPACHFLTPESERSTHYFYRGGQEENRNNPEYTAQFKAGVSHVVETEDAPMIETQQRFLGDRDLLDCRPAILKMDIQPFARAGILPSLYARKRSRPRWSGQRSCRSPAEARRKSGGSLRRAAARTTQSHADRQELQPHPRQKRSAGEGDSAARSPSW